MRPAIWIIRRLLSAWDGGANCYCFYRISVGTPCLSVCITPRLITPVLCSGNCCDTPPMRVNSTRVPYADPEIFRWDARAEFNISVGSEKCAEADCAARAFTCHVGSSLSEAARDLSEAALALQDGKAQDIASQLSFHPWKRRRGLEHDHFVCFM